MRRFVVAFAAAGILLGGGLARADDGASHPLKQFDEDPQGLVRIPNPGYFDGLGTPGRATEIESDTGFGSARVLTERVALAHAFPILRVLDGVSTTSLVVRVDAAIDTDTLTSFYGINGPIVSLGVRERSRSSDYWIEGGVRLLPGWGAPHANEPAALQLAYTASLTSGVADDARWLTFSQTGFQIYAAIQNRAQIGDDGTTKFLFGATYGGEVSLAPLQIESWLGPQTGIIGNAYLELFVGAPKLRRTNLNLQVGFHGEASLSSIWPGSSPLPLHGDIFLGWSPIPAFAARVFYGAAGSPLGSWMYPYGLRLEYYIP